LSLINNDRSKRNKNNINVEGSKYKETNTKNKSIIQSISSVYSRSDKENLEFTPTSFSKYKNQRKMMNSES